MEIHKNNIIRNIAVFSVVMMCIRYIPIDTRDSISPVKTLLTLLAPFFIALLSPKFNKAFLWGGVYWLVVLFSALFNGDSFRASTVLFLASFIALFIMYYNFVYIENAFDRAYYIRFLKRLIKVSTIALIVQQAFILVGIKEFPLINLVQVLNRGIGANSLYGEPSTFARVMIICFLSLLRLYEIEWGGKEKVTIKAIYAEDRWLVFAFLWSIFTMGSGTAMVGLFILILYFINIKYIVQLGALIFAFLLIVPHIDYEPIQRAHKMFYATLTLDTKNVKNTDTSAAVRVVPLINTFTKQDLQDSKTWFGHGIDSDMGDGRFGESRTVGGVRDYGLISYIISLIFVYSCCIKSVFSIETLMFFIILNAGIYNIPIFWGTFMILTTTKYFQEQKKTLDDNTHQ